MSSPLTVQRTEDGHRGAFFVEKDCARIAELTFSRVNRNKVILDHTEVDDSLRGQGVARQLLDSAVAWARESRT